MCYNGGIKISLMKTGILLNGLVLGALALAGSAWTFVVFSPEARLTEQGQVLDGDFQIGKKFSSDGLSSFVLNGRDSVTLLDGSEALVTWDEEAHHMEVELFAGSVLFSTLADDFTVTVRTSFVEVDSQNSMALVSLNLEAASASVLAIEHPSLVTFAQEGEELNALSVPNNHRMTISSAKVTETLAKLRLTKLTKEFPVYLISDGDLTEEANEALEELNQRYSEQALAFSTHLQDESRFGPATTGFGSTLASGYESFQDVLTVVPSAQDTLSADREKEALLYAMSHLSYGDPALGLQWLEEWKTYPHEVDEVKHLYSQLFFVVPGDELYPVKEAAAAFLYSTQDPMAALRREFIQVETLLERASQIDALKAYEAYQKQFEEALQAGTFDDPSYLDAISREYVLLELMLRSNAVFYNTDSTHLLSSLEDKIFALTDSDSDLDEERQAFVQSKIRFLSNLFRFVVEKKVTIEEATDLAEELIFEGESYLNSIVSQVAVRSYFEEQMEEFKFSVQFINSPEFYSYSSFEEGLEDYKIKLADLEDLNAYIQSIRAGEEELATLSLEDSIQEAKNDLYTNAIQYKDVESLGDGANRLFEIIGGRTGGYAFEAKYDRESRILYDVVVEGELRFSTGLSLENAKTVIQEAMTEYLGSDASSGEEELGSESSSNEEASLTEAVALAHVKDLFEEAGIDSDDFVFTVIDLEANLFFFEGIFTDIRVPISGSFDSLSLAVTELVWEWNGEPQVLPDTKLNSLEGALKATYEAMN